LAYADDTGLAGTIAKTEGILAKASSSAVGNLSQGKDLTGIPFSTPMEFTVRVACASTGTGQDQGCLSAVLGCMNGAAIDGVGLLYEILARPQGSNLPWRLAGTTCFADGVPGAGPVLTMARIIDAFRLTPWATATISTQPEGNLTLVTLPTYFRIGWSEKGYQPGEVDTLDPATMLGLRVQIRPRVDHFTYVFGDGTSFGPTRSEGGVWPTGDITHAYADPGTFATRVDTTFTGDYRVGDGPWTPIPDTVTVTGPVTTVTVDTARAVLVH